MDKPNKEKSALAEDALDNSLNINHSKPASKYQSTLHEAAIGYARKGLAIFPLSPRTKIPLKESKGFQDATVDIDQINRWWTQEPNANIGMATGKVSGKFVVDIDVDETKDGEASLRKLEAQYEPLQPSVEQITGGGGRQVMFEQPSNIITCSSAGQLGEGLDIRGDGGYVVLPPSIHPNGNRYEWSVDSESTFTPIPKWLLNLTTQSRGGNTVKSSQEWYQIAQGVTDGKRNVTLTQLAGKLFRVLPAHMAAELCAAWNEYRCKPPLDQQEFQSVIRSIAMRELKRRGGA